MGNIQIALDHINRHRAEKQLLVDYYNGNHRLLFATDRFRDTFGQILKSMKDNLCPIVVDASADRMEIINFSGDDQNKSTDESAWEIWKREQMELISNEAHIEILKTGEGYIIVWPDPVTGKAKFYLQDSRNCAVIRDEETDQVQFAAKLWPTSDGKLRLTLYYPDKLERFVTANKIDNLTELKESSFQVVTEGETANPYGVVPMFKFEANPVLSDAIPIQDALNKTICDKLVAMEFSAFRQRWVTGIDIPKDPVTGLPIPPFKAGADRIFSVDSKEAKFGDFNEANLEQFLKVADSYRLEMARVSGTPLHFFSINTSDAISGEALKTLESRFTKKVWRHCLNFGSTWAESMRLALQIDGKGIPGNLTVQWQSPEQRSDKEFLETLGLKRDTLDIPVDTLREEYGYTEEDIQGFNKAEGLEFDDDGKPDSTSTE